MAHNPSRQRKAPTFYASKDIKGEGSYALHLALTQNRRGALIFIVDEFEGAVGDTMKLPTSAVGDFSMLLSDLQSGKEKGGFALEGDRAIEGALTQDPVRGPLLLVTMKWGVGEEARAFTSTIPSGIVEAANAALQELVQEALHLPPLPPLPEPEPRQQKRRDRTDGLDNRLRISGTGNLARVVPQKKEPRKDAQKEPRKEAHPLLEVLTVIATQLGRIADTLQATTPAVPEAPAPVEVAPAPVEVAPAPAVPEAPAPAPAVPEAPAPAPAVPEAPAV